MLSSSSESQHQFVSMTITTVLLVAESCVGTVGNCLVIAVFRRSAAAGHTVTNLLITSLATIDLIICSVDIPVTIAWIIWQYPTVDLICKLIIVLKAFCVPVSALILVLISIDRFLVICFVPSILIHRSTSKVILTLIFLLGIVLAIPMALHTGVQLQLPPLFNDRLMQTLMLKPRQTNLSSTSFLPPPRPQLHQPPLQIFTVGICTTDETFISKKNYAYYKVSLFALFTFLMLLIVLFYTMIFTFLWFKHRKMRVYRSTKSTTIPAASSTTRSFIRHKSATSHCLDDSTTCTNLADKTVVVNYHNRRRRPHIKTAYTLGLIGITFVVSYLPYLLISNGFIFTKTSRDVLALSSSTSNLNSSITDNSDLNDSSSIGRNSYGIYLVYVYKLLFYLYFTNSVLNPIIYSVTNNQFKNDVKKTWLFQIIFKRS